MRNIRHLVVSNKHHRAEIDSSKVQKNPLARLRVADDLAGIPEKLIRFEQPPDSRKRTFQRERHKYLAIPFLRPSGSIGNARDRIIPFAVEARPLVADHLGPRI